MHQGSNTCIFVQERIYIICFKFLDLDLKYNIYKVFRFGYFRKVFVIIKSFFKSFLNTFQNTSPCGVV